LEIIYELVPEDVWQYNLYYRRHKATLRPVFLYALAALVGVVYLGAILIIVDSWLRYHQPQWAMLLYLAAMPFFVSRFLPATKKRVVKLHSQRAGFFCEHIVGISPEWLSERTTVNDTKMAWTTIQAIEEDQNYFFLFISKSVAHIIPKRAFSSPHEAQVFLSDTRRYWDAAKTRTPVIADNPAVWPPAPRPGA